jgi:type IV pilus assembly protein PilE
MRLKHVAGITLIELMIVVAIIAIVAAIAFPSYQAQVQKSRRAEAKSTLASVQLAQERLFTVNGSYALGTGASPFTALDLAGDLTVAATSITTPQGFYTVSMAGAATATSFTLRAVGVNGQQDDTNCRILLMDHLGAKISSGDNSITAINSATVANDTGCW